MPVFNQNKKANKKILLFKLAMDNGKFIYTDTDGSEKLDEFSKDSLVMVREYKRRTEIYATWEGNFLVNPYHICYATPVMLYEVLEGDLDNA